MNGAETIGDYALLERIAMGGMAEIYLAKRVGPQQFEKSVVIKRLLPTLAGDEKFTQMFLDEARLAARLSHPNIVQIYDLGRHEDSYYIAMEYLVGEDLAGVIVRHIERDEVMDPWLAARMFSQAAEGLHYAHTLTDADGRPLHIVHRDISPSNIIVTSQGVVKLLDFGIAKAVGRVVKTETGVLKGKVAYMAPEQLGHRQVDHRADIYALGVTLFETLSSSRMFGGLGQYDLFRAVARGDLPSLRERAPDVPAELENVVARCLALDPADRYASGEDLQRDLDEFLVRSGRVPTNRDIVRALEGLFGAGHFETLDRRQHQRAHAAESSPSDEVMEATEITLVDGAAGADATASLHMPLDETLDEPRSEEVTVVEGSPTRLERLGEAGNAEDAVPQTETLAAESVTGADEWNSSPSEMFAEDSTSTDVGLFEVSTIDVEPQVPFAGDPTRPHPPAIRPRPRAAIAVGALAVLVLASVVWGLSREGSAPAAPEVASTAPLLEPGRLDSVIDVAEEIPADSLVESSATDPSETSDAEEPDLRRSGFGLLSLDSNVLLRVRAGKRQLGTTPLSRVRLPAGSTALRLSNAEEGISRTHRVVIREGRLTQETIRLRKGKLSIDVEPWANVYLGSMRLGTTPMINEPVWEGSHTLLLENDELGLKKRVRIVIQPDKTTRLREALR